MKIGYSSTLQRTMIMYLLLIGFASSMVGTEFILDVHSKEFRSQLMQRCEQLSHHEIQPDEVYEPIQNLQSKAILMVIIVFVVMTIVLSMFIKNITEPLQHMIEVSKEISKGDLSRTIDIRADNELAALGGTLNELTSNLQELAMLSEDVCVATMRFVEKMARRLQGGDPASGSEQELRADIQELNPRISLLLEIVKDFKLYQIEG